MGIYKNYKKMGLESHMNLATFNINGLRAKLKNDLLGKMLKDAQVGVCVVSETHRRKEDLKTAQYPKYKILADHCRETPIGEQIKGGVLILVHTDFSAEEIPKREELRDNRALHSQSVSNGEP